jgi:hypothetical protein
MSSPRQIVRKIISGGQTGADRAALETAIELGIPHGGWVPQGRWAEDGSLDSRYQVDESASPEPAVRTERNVRAADATLIIAHGPLTGGSALTQDLALRYAKPLLVIDLDKIEESAAVDQVRNWLTQTQPAVLNVAGPRASTDLRIYDAVRRILQQAFLETRQ